MDSILSIALSTASSQALLLLGVTILRLVIMPLGLARTMTTTVGLPALESVNVVFCLMRA